MSPEEAHKYPLNEAERNFIEGSKSWHLRGKVNDVIAQLKREQELYGFDELMICTIPYAQEVKLKQYEMLAEGFGLTQEISG